MTRRKPVLVLIGTKAQFIKTAPLLRVFDRRGIDCRIIYTGQHSETFDQLEAVLGTRPADDNLVPCTEADTNFGFLAWTLRFWVGALRRVLRKEWSGAAWGVVHGDTASTLFGALALRLAGVPVAHVEAGLRSPRLLIPFPEEIVRRLVSRIATLHFAPDAEAVANLGHARGRVVNTNGNTLRDVLRLALERISPLPAAGGTGGYAIVSLHRSENLQSPADLRLLMEEVMLAASHLPVRFVLHPVTRAKLRATGWIDRLNVVPGLTLIDRMDYVSFVRMLIEARFLLTDGGSNQEEAAMLGLPTLLMRRATERPDGLANGTVKLSGLQREAIRNFVKDRANETWPLVEVQGRSPSEKIADLLGELVVARSNALGDA